MEHKELVVHRCLAPTAATDSAAAVPYRPLELLAFILVPEEAEATGSYAQDDEDNWQDDVADNLPGLPCAFAYCVIWRSHVTDPTFALVAV